MAELLETPFPIGTPAELEAAGINAHLNGSCAPPDNANGFKGCSYYENCVFARSHDGGKVKAFRDQGPKNFGYSIHLSEWGPERPANEDWMPCHRFMATVFRRMAHANYLRENEPSKPRDDIKIIANEGELIWLHHQVSKVPGSNKVGDLGLKPGEPKFRIPIHPRPNQVMEVQGVAADIAAEREAERQKPEKETKGARVPA